MPELSFKAKLSSCKSKLSSFKAKLSFYFLPRSDITKLLSCEKLIKNM